MNDPRPSRVSRITAGLSESNDVYAAYTLNDSQPPWEALLDAWRSFAVVAQALYETKSLLSDVHVALAEPQGELAGKVLDEIVELQLSRLR